MTKKDTCFIKYAPKTQHAPNGWNRLFTSEAVARRCSVKKVFLEISQNLQENTCARFSFLIKLQVSAFSYRTPPVAASDTSTIAR